MIASLVKSFLFVILSYHQTLQVNCESESIFKEFSTHGGAFVKDGSKVGEWRSIL